MISFAYESIIYGTVIIAAAASGVSYLFLMVLNNPFLESTIKTPLLIVIGFIDAPLLLFIGFAVISGVLMLLFSIIGGIAGFIESIFDHLTGAHAHRKQQNQRQKMSKENYKAFNNLESEKLKAEMMQNTSEHALVKRLLWKCAHKGCHEKHKDWTYVSGQKIYLCKEHYQDYRNTKTKIDEFENIEAIAVLSQFLYDLSNRKPDNDFAVNGRYYSQYKKIQIIKGLIDDGNYSRAVRKIQDFVCL